jgi:predicted TPR repeat methyltransferase
VLLYTFGYLDDALKLAKQLESALPEDPEIHYLSGEIYAGLNDDSNSTRSYQQAITGFLDQFRRHEPDAATLIKMSRCLIANKEGKKAHACLKQVLTLAPSMPAAHYQMGQLFERTNQPVNALKAYRHCLKIKPDHAESLTAYSELMAGKGRLDKSAWAYRRLLLQTPEHAGLKHLLKASSSGKVQGGADEQYVKDVFDDYADTFDDHLVNTLAYYTPEKLERLFSNTICNAKGLSTIDLGCGTGLCGPLFRLCSKQLVGVDLSSGMLEKAAGKACYDELLNCDLVAGLKRFHGSLDLAVAADVFVYVGELQEIFSACFKALNTGGHLLFSVESTASRKGLVLQPSGRYQHSAPYVERLLEKNHFTLVRKEPADIRIEVGKPVLGALYLVRKEAFSPLY